MWLCDDGHAEKNPSQTHFRQHIPPGYAPSLWGSPGLLYAALLHTLRVSLYTWTLSLAHVLWPTDVQAWWRRRLCLGFVIVGAPAAGHSLDYSRESVNGWEDNRQGCGWASSPAPSYGRACSLQSQGECAPKFLCTIVISESPPGALGQGTGQ